MKKRITLLLLLAILAVYSTSHAHPEVVLDNVPAYEWYHGCGPTALGMIFGYWDLHGYDKLFPGLDNWDNVRQTANVTAFLSRDAYNDFYDDIVPGATSGCQSAGDPVCGCCNDGPGDPPAPGDSIADYWGTSKDSDKLGDGWSLSTKTEAAIENYTGDKGYDFTSSATISVSSLFEELIWNNVLKGSIDLGKPLLFLVESPHSGNHYVAVIGYDDDHHGQGRHYAFFDTYDENESALRWEKFQAYSAGVNWSVRAVTTVDPAPTLAHALAAIQAVAGVDSGDGINLLQVVGDYDRNGKIGMPEALYILQKIADLR